MFCDGAERSRVGHTISSLLWVMAFLLLFSLRFDLFVTLRSLIPACCKRERDRGRGCG